MGARRKTQVVAIGQVPPPVTGQSVMIRMLVDATFPEVEITHVPMMLSDDVASQGSFAYGKLMRMVRVPFAAIRARYRSGARILYYPPSGSARLAILRDIFVLLLTRPFFRRTVFHFHASGMSEVYPTLPGPVRWLYRRALMHPDVMVRISPSSPSELEHLQGRREMLVANGIDDPADGFVRAQRAEGPLRILFVGHLMEGKGILVLLEAFAELLRRGLAVHLTCIGKWSSEAIQSQAEQIVRLHNLADHVSFAGGIFGEAKWSCFRQADIFCFPSFYQSEVFPLVLLEAMAFSLPIVSTRWRGIPDVVSEGQNAMLVAPRDANACADALEKLVMDAALRARFGEASRTRFLKNFRSDVHLAAMEQVFLAAAES